MPIVGRPPGPDPTHVARSGGDGPVCSNAPPGDLLPLGGVSAPAPASALQRALALDAIRVLRGLRDRPRDAGLWGEPAFAREVELVRGHLAPIRSRCGLVSSFGREASWAPEPERPDMAVRSRPLRVAYALRWLELGDGVSRPGWIDLVAGRDRRVR